MAGSLDAEGLGCNWAAAKDPCFESWIQRGATAAKPGMNFLTPGSQGRPEKFGHQSLETLPEEDAQEFVALSAGSSMRMHDTILVPAEPSTPKPRNFQ
jgi:hypothetical protein